jgi:cell division protein FtsL
VKEGRNGKWRENLSPFNPVKHPATLLTIAAGFAAIFATVWQSNCNDALNRKIDLTERSINGLEEEYRNASSRVATLRTPESLYGKAMEMDLDLERIKDR